MNQVAIRTYNTVYNALKSRVSARGMSFQVSAFADGSAVVLIHMTSGNKSASVSAILSPKFYEQDLNAPKAYVVADGREVYDAQNIEIATSRIAYLVQQAWQVFNKIRTS